jgi:hypothetical protein
MMRVGSGDTEAQTVQNSLSGGVDETTPLVIDGREYRRGCCNARVCTALCLVSLAGTTTCAAYLNSDNEMSLGARAGVGMCAMVGIVAILITGMVALSFCKDERANNR